MTDPPPSNAYDIAWGLLMGGMKPRTLTVGQSSQCLMNRPRNCQAPGNFAMMREAIP